MSAENKTLFDVRVVSNNIRRELLSHKDYAAHLASLPDEADEARDSEVLFTSPSGDRRRFGADRTEE